MLLVWWSFRFFFLTLISEVNFFFDDDFLHISDFYVNLGACMCAFDLGIIHQMFAIFLFLFCYSNWMFTSVNICFKKMRSLRLFSLLSFRSYEIVCIRHSTCIALYYIQKGLRILCNLFISNTNPAIYLCAHD